MHEADGRSRLCHSLESERKERAQVLANREQRDPAGWEVSGVERALESASSDGDDTTEGGGGLEEREQVGHEAGAGVEG